LYRNEAKAYELLEEINTIIERLEQSKNPDEKLINKFLEVNKKQVDKISHVVSVSIDQELANFNQLNSGANIENIFIANNSIIATDALNNSLYQFNQDDKTVSILKDEVQYADYGANLNNDEILLISANGNTIINKDLNVNSNDEAISDDPHEITDIATYNNRVYILSATKNNVFRYARSYNTREAWIKEDLDIRDAVSLDIDGYIYILKSGGEVIKLLSGYSDNFKLSPVNPPLSNASRLKLSD